MQDKRLPILRTIVLLSVFLFVLTTRSFADTTAWNGKDLDTSWYETHEQETIYTLKTPEQLAGLAAIVDGTANGITQSDFQGKKILLASDLDLNSEEWTPIGVAEDKSFNGTFDGQNFIIENLKISGSEDGSALFGYTGTDAFVENLSVSGDVVGNRQVAGIVAVGSGTIKNVTNQVNITVQDSNAAGILAKGIKEVTVTSCYNKGTVTNTSKEQSSGRLAGIVGSVDTDSKAVINMCSNSGAITGYQYIGGIIGAQFGDVDVSACYNTGKLTAVSFGKAYLGGISGKCQGGTITNCYNQGALYDSHWAEGHIRAIGGIAGCEEDRTGGATVITNCYTTGSIDADTANMVPGTNFIYMVGNISGGDSSTGANTMQYENCYYLEERIAFADPAQQAYQLWADVYKADPSLWDTKYIEKKTEIQMKSAEFVSEIGDSFIQDKNHVNNGYPILYWQDGSGSGPSEKQYSISGTVYGEDGASIDAADSAHAGENVTFYIKGLPESKQVQKIEIIDAAGRDITCTKKDNGYCFEMPKRNVAISVYIEAVVAEDVVTHKIQIREDLDPIWDLKVESGSLNGETVKTGATVMVNISKSQDAAMTSLEGMQVIGSDAGAITTYKTTKDSYGNGVAGVYAFTMPDRDVTIDPRIQYRDFNVYTKAGEKGVLKLEKSYSREEMLDLAETLYFTGYASDKEAFVGKAEQAVTLTSILRDAGLEKSCVNGTSFKVSGIDGMDQTYSYEKLYGSTRYYYPNIISGSDAAEKAAGRLPVDAMFMLKGYMAAESDGNVEEKNCDTRSAYRFVFGQTEKEFNNGIPAVEYKVNSYMPKCVSSLVVIAPERQTISAGTVKGLKAAAKSYCSVFLSWSGAPSAKGYEIQRAEFAKGSYKTIKTTTATAFTDTAVKTGQTYYYRVRGYALSSDNKKIYGAYSSKVTAKPVLRRAAISLKAGKKSITVKWKKVSGAKGYRIYRSTQKTKGYKNIKTITKGTTIKYTDKKLKKGKRYYYKARAYRKVSGKNVYGSYSAVKSAKAK